MRMDRLPLANFLVSLATLLLLLKVFLNPLPPSLPLLPPPPYLPPYSPHLHPKCNSTIVSAYYNISSKHPHSQYVQWMANFLSLRDCMVIFVSPDMVGLVTSLRPPSYPSLILPRPLESFKTRAILDSLGWERQEAMDRELGAGHSRQLYWIWNEKTEMLKMASDLNPFLSSFFVWLDIGAVRHSNYNHQKLINNRPEEEGVLLLQVEPFSSSELEADYHDFSKVNRIGGGTIGCGKQSLSLWHEAYYDTIKKYLQQDKFVGKDQSVMAETCLRTGLCLMVEGDNNHWFLLQEILRGDRELKYKHLKKYK